MSDSSGTSNIIGKEVWIYDFRTNIHFTLKQHPLAFEDLADFIQCYKPGSIAKRKQTWDEEKNPEGRWRKSSYGEIIENLEAGIESFKEIYEALE